ncbi:NtaA/DmoA family FMN-dependent monooxygenase [Millisia brevis]|uniref:NtaA/DmoA family FMN-dependent monooxygenase n=1 Tax=Millisia brevis TaxID=264148 RepID=UPI0008320BCC|nr:NtaA/DmoA family FMN-dependent monooxygenase [Millisia brevis]
MSDRDLKLGIFLQGGGGHWRDPAVAPDGAADIRTYIEAARVGDQAKLDFGFIADSAYISQDSTWPLLSRLEPMTALSAISSVTDHLGLVGTFTTSYSEPFTTARQLASLDKISGGRVGWNAVTSALEGVARNHGGQTLYDHAERYRIADEYIRVVKGLWNSWEDDAFVRDVAANRYVDFDKMHTLDHKGEYFGVQGPLNIERSAQGHPVVFQAGASEAGRDLAARQADAVFSTWTSHGDLASARENYVDWKRRAESYGRNPDHLLILPSITPIVGSTRAQAQEIYEESIRYDDINHALKYLSRYFSFYDFSRFDLDKPLPELGDIGANSFKSTAEYYLRTAKERNLTLRQLALEAANPPGEFVGTATDIADKLSDFFVGGAVDGVILGGTIANIRRFLDDVLPILEDRGLRSGDRTGTTLRENLGLPFPVNTHTRQRVGV